jgi:hypothetical protein
MVSSSLSSVTRLNFAGHPSSGPIASQAAAKILIRRTEIVLHSSAVRMVASCSLLFISHLRAGKLCPSAGCYVLVALRPVGRLFRIGTRAPGTVRQATLHRHGDLRHHVPGSIIRSELPATSKLASDVFQEPVALLGQERGCG